LAIANGKFGICQRRTNQPSTVPTGITIGSFGRSISLFQALKILAHVVALPRRISRDFGELIPVMIDSNHGVVRRTATERPSTRVENPLMLFIILAIAALLFFVGIVFDKETPP